MTHDVDAIFDDGVFRPIEPVDLPDGTRVHLRVEAENGAEKNQPAHLAGGSKPMLSNLSLVV
jgi:predicted DNA-binding antitoxin AbrB/MazE fold protein